MSDGRLAAEVRTVVIDRARGICEYCGSQARFATQSFSIEHIVPRSKGGTSTPENLALACQGCNNHKYNKISGRDPATGEIIRLFHPRHQSWDEHFVWNEDYSLIIGITAWGRTTVETLQLNRSALVGLRRVLFAMGEHPPTSIDG